MHIAAMKPVALTSKDVPANLIEKERSVATAKAAESGKPADIATKMIEGSVQKYLKEVSLFDQTFVKNDKQTVEQMLKAEGTTVKGFTLYIVGEGIEKKVDDFAAEVAAQNTGIRFYHHISTKESPLMSQPVHHRILLKLSGEALMGDDSFGINRDTIVRMVAEIKDVVDMGVQVAIVIGGGNIFRGVAGGSVGMDRATADYMGMLATVMNALALADTMNHAGLTARVMSAINIEQIVEP
ncbi:unnamed protein product, partial [Darwinula stevensoni]